MGETVADTGPRVVLRLADERARLAIDGPRVTLTVDGAAAATVDLPSAEAAALVADLSAPAGLAEADLAASRDAARVHLALERLRARAETSWELRAADGPLARAVALVPGFDLLPDPGGDTLDGAAHLRADPAGDPSFPAILSSPDLSCEIRLSPAGARLAGALLAGGGGPEIAAMRSFLARCGVGGRDAARRAWSFHDRVMHAATRPPDDGRPIAVAPGSDPAARPPAMEWLGAAVAPAASPADDGCPPRRSLRDFAPEPPAVAAIRDWLSRSLAYQAVRGLGETRWVERPFPAAGGLGEIIGYVAVRAAGGLSPGLYRHDPLADRLDPVEGDPSGLARVFDGAATALLRPGRPPPAVLILASRVDQLAWKYGPLGYRLALLNAGAAAAVVQLAAAEVGLGCCPLGTGEARSLAALTGRIDPPAAAGGHEEIPLLEIAFGVRPGAVRTDGGRP